MFIFKKSDCLISIAGPFLTFTFPGCLASSTPFLFHGHDGIVLKKYMDEHGILSVSKEKFELNHRWIPISKANNTGEHCHFRMTKKIDRENVECIFNFLHQIALMVEQGSYLSFTFNNYELIKYHYSLYLNKYGMPHFMDDIRAVGYALDIEYGDTRATRSVEENANLERKIFDYCQKGRLINGKTSVGEIQSFVTRVYELFPKNEKVKRIYENGNKLILALNGGSRFVEEKNVEALAGLTASHGSEQQYEVWNLKNKHVIYSLVLMSLLANDGLSYGFMLKSLLLIISIAALPPHTFKELDSRLLLKGMKHQFFNHLISPPAITAVNSSAKNSMN